jgi:hypothetical protein
MNIVIKINASAAKKLLKSLPENHKIKIKVEDLEKILGNTKT